MNNHTTLEQVIATALDTSEDREDVQKVTAAIRNAVLLVVDETKICEVLQDADLEYTKKVYLSGADLTADPGDVYKYMASAISTYLNERATEWLL